MTKEKYIKQSKTEQIQIVMSRHINGNSRLFGGALMQWVDVVAATVARRHSETDVTTAFIDSLSFKAPAFLNNIVLLNGKLTF
ncbi:MAG: hotdog domain-containing protein, partial [Clostridia bacterium]